MGPVELLKWDHRNLGRRVKTGVWTPSSPIVAEECLRREGRHFTEEVGNTPCKRYLVTNGTTTWWIPREREIYWAKKKQKGKPCIHNPREDFYQCYHLGRNLYSEIPEVSKFWKNANRVEHQYWEAPNGLVCICQRKVYPLLPPRWQGSSTLGVIQPRFFFFQRGRGTSLECPCMTP